MPKSWPEFSARVSLNIRLKVGLSEKLELGGGGGFALIHSKTWPYFSVKELALIFSWGVGITSRPISNSQHIFLDHDLLSRPSLT